MAFFGNPADTISTFYDNFGNTVAKKLEKVNTAIQDQNDVLKSLDKKQDETTQAIKMLANNKGSSGGGSNNILDVIKSIGKTAGVAAGIGIVTLGIVRIAKAMSMVQDDVETKSLKFTAAIYMLLKSIETIQDMKGMSNPVKVFMAMESARFIVYYSNFIIEEINKVPKLDHGVIGDFNLNNIADSKFRITTDSKLFSTMITIYALKEIFGVFKVFNEVYNSVSVVSSIMFMLFGTSQSIIKLVQDSIIAINKLPDLDHGIVATIDLNNFGNSAFKLTTKSKLFNVLIGSMATLVVLSLYEQFLDILNAEALNGKLSNVILIRYITPFIFGTIKVAMEQFMTLVGPAKALMTSSGQTDIGSILGIGNTGLMVPNYIITAAAVSFAMIPIAKAFSHLAEVKGVSNPLKIGMMYFTVPLMIYTMGGALRALNAVDIGPINMQMLVSMAIKTFMMGQLAGALIPVSEAFGRLLEVLVIGRKQSMFAKLADAGIFRYVFGGKGLTAKEFFSRAGGGAKTSIIISSFAAIILTMFALVGVIAVLNLVPVSNPVNLIAKAIAVTVLSYAITPLMESFLVLYSTIWDQSSDKRMDILENDKFARLFSRKERKKLILGKIPFARILTTTVIAGLVTFAMASVLTITMPKLLKAAGTVGSGTRVIALSIGIYFASLALGVVVKSFIKLYLMLNEVTSGGEKANALTSSGNLLGGSLGSRNRKFNLMKDIGGFLKMMAILPVFGLGIVAVAAVFKLFSIVKPSSSDVPPIAWVAGVGFTLFVFAQVFAVVLGAISKANLKKKSIASGGGIPKKPGVSGLTVGMSIATIIGLAVGIVAIAMVMKFMPRIDPGIVTSMIFMGVGLTFLAIPLVIFALTIARIIKVMNRVKIGKPKLSGLFGGNILSTLGEIGKAIIILVAATIGIAMITAVLNIIPIVSAPVPPLEMIMKMLPALVVIGIVAYIMAPIYKTLSETSSAKSMKGGKKGIAGIFDSPLIKLVLIMAVAALAVGIISMILGTFDWKAMANFEPPSAKFLLGLIPSLLVIGLIAGMLALVSKIAKGAGLKDVIIGGLIMVAAAGAFVGINWILSAMPKDDKLRVLPDDFLKNQVKVALALGVIGLIVAGVGVIAKAASPVGLALGALAILLGGVIMVAIGFGLSFLPSNTFGAGSTFNNFIDSIVYMSESIIKMLIRVINYGLVSLVDTFTYAMLKLFGLFGYDPNRDDKLARAALASGGTVVLGDQINISGDATINQNKGGFFEKILDKIPEIDKLIQTLSKVGIVSGTDIMGGLIAIGAGLSAFFLVMTSGAALDVANSVLHGIAGTIRWLTGQSTDQTQDPVMFLTNLINKADKLHMVSESLTGVAIGLGAIVKASKTSVKTDNVTSFLDFVDAFLKPDNNISKWTYWDDKKQMFTSTRKINKLVAFSQVMKSIGGGLFGLVKEDEKFFKIVKSFGKLSESISDMVEAINKMDTEKIESLNKQFDKIQELADSNAIKRIEESKSLATKTSEMFNNLGESLGLKQQKEEEEERKIGRDKKMKSFTKGDIDDIVKEVAKKFVEELERSAFTDRSGGGLALRTSNQE